MPEHGPQPGEAANEVIFPEPLPEVPNAPLPEAASDAVRSSISTASDRVGAAWLHSRSSELQLSQPVQYEVDRRVSAGEQPLVKPADRIDAWMKILEHTHGHQDQPEVLERIKASYHGEYVIQPEMVPESVFLLEQKIARELGHGDITITDEFRQAKVTEIISNQETSLDRWVDYLASNDATYPTWAKYWAFDSVTKMGKFDKQEQPDGRETVKFVTRDVDTVAPFPPLNPRALALAIGSVEAKITQRQLPKSERTSPENPSTKLSDQEFQQLLSSESFPKLYAQFLVEIPQYSKEGLRETRGQWIKYDRGSDPVPLVASLEGHPLEWCTVNTETARSQLQGGDFYIYYSIDENGNAVIPRAAIRMAGDSIAEVRGIAADQNLDPYISDVISEKMGSFEDGDYYQKRAADMARVTDIDERAVRGGVLTKEDLRFLYLVDGPITGFGYESDPRIDALLNGRDSKSDLAMVFDCRREQIGTTPKDVFASTEPLEFYLGELDLNVLTTAEGLTLPKIVYGDLDLNGLTTAEGLTLPKIVNGYLNLRGLTIAEGLTFPETLNGNLYLNGLTTVEGLILPKAIYGDLNLRGLTIAEGLTFPETLNGGLYLNGLTTARGLTLPKIVNGDLNLRGLTTAEGLTLPKVVNGEVFLMRWT